MQKECSTLPTANEQKCRSQPDSTRAAIATWDDLPNDAQVNVKVVALVTGTSVPTVWRHARIGLLPAPRHFGGSTRWNVGELRAVLRRKSA